MENIDDVKGVRKELRNVVGQIFVPIRNDLYHSITNFCKTTLVGFSKNKDCDMTFGDVESIDLLIDWTRQCSIFTPPKGGHDHDGGHLSIFGLNSFLLAFLRSTALVVFLRYCLEPRGALSAFFFTSLFQLFFLAVEVPLLSSWIAST